MSTATASFFGDESHGLAMSTAVLAGGSFDHKPDGPTSWEDAAIPTGMFEAALMTALSADGSYPLTEALQMQKGLGWHSGQALLRQHPPSSLKLTMSYHTCPLMPEYLPFGQKEDGSWIWLDRIYPLYRTLEHSEGPRVLRSPDLSIALVYQDAEEFRELAENLRWGLQREVTEGVTVDRYPGSRFSGGPAERERTLFEVFRKHRAVIFIGHLAAGQHNHHGWKLTDSDVLTMEELRKFLDVGTTGLLQAERHGPLHSLLPVPELVFANCCFSAGHDPDTRSSYGLSYPKLFMDAGVRFFVGTSRDVVFKDVEPVSRIALEFIARWCKDPDGAIRHLWEAKKAVDFHLVSGLYQIYTAGDESPAPGPKPHGVSAVVSGISPGDTLGEYVIESEMWTDPYARSFWASHIANRTGHVVQVLVDEWQNSPGIADSLDEAVEKLNDAELTAGHLVPSRAERAVLRSGDHGQSELSFLVFDRPPGESAGDWYMPSPALFGEVRPERDSALLDTAWQICQSVADMHEKRIPHGNLTPSTIAIAHSDGQNRAYIRDAWVWQFRPGRSAWPEYAPPEEGQNNADIDELKRDCYGLGLIIQGLTADTEPIEALDRVSRELLVPSPRLRPSAAFVRDRLAVALMAGGTYLGDLEHEIAQHIAAGHRLFAVTTDDPDELESALNGLVRQGHRLYTLSEGVGLADKRQNSLLVEWIPAAEIAAAMGPQSSQVDSAMVSRINGEAIVQWLAMSKSADAKAPIILVHGARWWDSGPACWRSLRSIQAAAPESPVIVVADSHAAVATSAVALNPDLSRQFVAFPFPPPSPASLFEHILAFHREEGLPEPIPPELAMKLAEGLYPISRRETTNLLRMGLHRHGAVDTRILTIRDDAREELFRTIGVVSYKPTAKLRPTDEVGLAPPLQSKLVSWVDHVLTQEQVSGQAAAFRRVLVHGPDGSGKTSVAESIAARLDRPLVRLDPGSCLRGRLGESEDALRMVLAIVGGLHRSVALLDDVHRFVQVPAGQQTDSLAGTMQRMQGVLLQWLDNLPAGCIVVVTAASPDRLPAQWRRRMDREFHVTSAESDPEQRRAVFSAALRHHGLDVLAADDELVAGLADSTHPRDGIPMLASPSARAADGPLRRDVSRLCTAADIADWVSETLLLHGNRDNPVTAAFWRAALVSITQGDNCNG